jgi:hypothetical protein
MILGNFKIIHTSFTTSLDNILVYMLCFFPKKYFDAEFSRKNYFCKEKIFSPIKIAFFWLQDRNHSLPDKFKGQSLTRFHYYIFLPGYGYNGIFCGHCQIAVGVHWMEFVSHVKFRQLQTTTLGISEQYPFFCHQTGMVGHWILRLHTFYKSTHVDFKTLVNSWNTDTKT